MHSPFAGAEKASPQVVHQGFSTERAARWLLESGIQERSGGVARYYRSDTHALQPVSTEITSYAAATLVYLHQLTGEAKLLDAAVRAGHYLTRVAWNPVLKIMPFECRPRGELAYFFDLGIIARGLLALWRGTGDDEFLQTATLCARAMAEDFPAASGYYAVLSLPGKQPVAGNGRWSREPGCYQLKSAMAWLEVGGDYAPLYREAVAGFLENHSFFLEAEPPGERLMDRLHAYCYFLEGLLPSAVRSDCAAVLSEGIARVGRSLREIGPVFERSDVRAQLLRLRLYAAALGVCPLDGARAAQEATALQNYQLDHADPRVDGGFGFGRKALQSMPFVNPASTAFCVQALAMWRQFQAGEFRPAPLELI